MIDTALARARVSRDRQWRCASDRADRGESTFMVELRETAAILRRATPRSLVLLDELGRGTSTFDGTAIAYATAAHLAHDVRCPTLFVTHFPQLAELAVRLPGAVVNRHMAFVHDGADGAVERIAFLYKVAVGFAERSYGINVARLAGIPRAVLEVASRRSAAMAAEASARRAARDRRFAAVVRAARAALAAGNDALNDDAWLAVADALTT